MNDRLPPELPRSGGTPEPAGQALVRIGAGGSRRPLGAVAATLVLLAALVWQPWSGAAPPPASTHQPAPSSVADTRTAAPSASPATISVNAEPAAYLSLIDNEWTVVALLSPTAAGPAEEPALPHPTDVAGSGAPLLVLQQGVLESAKPIERAGKPNLACTVKTIPRDQRAVPLPADRVLYLGVTFPGINQSAKVTVADLDGASQVLTRVPSLVASLSGGPAEASYRLPSSGPGAVVLFALPRGTALPNGSYRFKVDAPGAGIRYVYACVGG
jgi:hypothetical protein